MEYPSKNDLFLKFKVLYDENHEFLDYILIDSSENYHNVINNKSNPMVGKKITEIVLEDSKDILGLKYLYYHMIPKTRRKFEFFNEKLERWYLVNIFSDEKDYLIIFYSDIDRYKDKVKRPPIKPFKGYEKRARRCI